MLRTDDLRIREMKELIPPSHLIREFGCSEKAADTAANARTALHRILHAQDDRVMVVIGPCSIHDPKLRWNTRTSSLRNVSVLPVS